MHAIGAFHVRRRKSGSSCVGHGQETGRSPRRGPSGRVRRRDSTCIHGRGRRSGAPRVCARRVLSELPVPVELAVHRRRPGVLFASRHGRLRCALRDVRRNRRADVPFVRSRHCRTGRMLRGMRSAAGLVARRIFRRPGGVDFRPTRSDRASPFFRPRFRECDFFADPLTFRKVHTILPSRAQPGRPGTRVTSVLKGTKT